MSIEYQAGKSRVLGCGVVPEVGTTKMSTLGGVLVDTETSMEVKAAERGPRGSVARKTVSRVKVVS